MEHLYLDRAAVILASEATVGEFFKSGAGATADACAEYWWSQGQRQRATNYCAVLDEDLCAKPWQSWSILGAIVGAGLPAGALAHLGIRSSSSREGRRAVEARWREGPARLYLVKNIM